MWPEQEGRASGSSRQWLLARTVARVLLAAGPAERWLHTQQGRDTLGGCLAGWGYPVPEGEDPIAWGPGMLAVERKQCPSPWAAFSATARALRLALKPEGADVSKAAKRRGPS